MSVILKALKTAENEKEETDAFEEDLYQDDDSGYFESKESFIKKPPPVTQKESSKGLRSYFLYLLIAVFVLVASFALTMKFLFRTEPTKTLSNKIEYITPKETTKPIVKTPPMTLTTDNEEELSSEDLINNAYLAYNSQEYDLSLKLFRQALVNNATNAFLHNSLGMVFLQKGLFSNASSSFQKALELDDQCSECFNNIGFLKSMLGETIEATKYFEKAIDLSNSYPDPYFNLAVLYEKEGDVGNAVNHYKLFVQIHPDQKSDIVQKVIKRISTLTGK